jgi:acyl carrier protein
VTREEIEKRLKDLICEQMGSAEDDVKGTATFTTDLGADSLDVVEIVMATEETFNIELLDEEVAEVQTVGDAATLIERVLNRKEPDDDKKSG